MKKENKRAQVTIFIIIAVIIVILLVLFFIFRSKGDLDKEINLDPEIEPVYYFIENCIRKTGQNALQRVGEQGGYFFIPQNNPSIDNRIPYYIYERNIYFPEKQVIESSLSGFIYEELSFCILNFKEFEEFEINHELKNVNTEIVEGKVIFNLEYLVNIKRENLNSNLNNFKIEVPNRLNTIYNTAYETVNEQKNHGTSICLSCLYDLGEQNNVNIDMLDYGNDTTIFTILDNNLINNKSYEFNFAIQYE